jgi:hypothetical protein
MSISTYFRPNIHQNGPEILGVYPQNLKDITEVDELLNAIFDFYLKWFKKLLETKPVITALVSQKLSKNLRTE